MSEKKKEIIKAVIFFLFALSCLGSLLLDVKSSSKTISMLGLVFFTAIGIAFLKQALRK